MMQTPNNQISIISNLPEEYAFRSSTELQVRQLVPLAAEMLRRCLDSGLEGKHLIAMMYLCNSAKMREKTMKNYIAMCVPRGEVQNYLVRFQSIKMVCNLTPPLERQRIDFTAESLGLINELLTTALSGDFDKETMSQLLDKYETSQTSEIFDMKNLSFLLYFLQPEKCPIFNYLDGDELFLKENFGYDGKYSTYLEIFNIIASHSQEKNMLHLAWMLNLRGGFNPSLRVAAAAESLVNLSDGYWDNIFEEKS